ncbi:MAG: winged helix-turn-helix transcriptional regulator [Leptolyngbyaceae cyanobacterium CAN_BIN12]|nr:winged helix-turn-helix transcriptional regulator [Leptolyngbyaceae cyanobacterium CAN_BIN12]
MYIPVPQAISPDTRKWAGQYYRHEPTVPPQVTYGLTERGLELCDVLDQLNALAESWYSKPLDLQQVTVCSR